MQGKEGWAQKRDGGRHVLDAHHPLRRWRKRWLTARESFIGYYKSPADTHPREVLLVDEAFAVQRLNDQKTFVVRRFYCISPSKILFRQAFTHTEYIYYLSIYIYINRCVYFPSVA